MRVRAYLVKLGVLRPLEVYLQVSRAFGAPEATPALLAPRMFRFVSRSGRTCHMCGMRSGSCWKKAAKPLLAPELSYALR
jgi:hypothetical protein